MYSLPYELRKLQETLLTEEEINQITSIRDAQESNETNGYSAKELQEMF